MPTEVKVISWAGETAFVLGGGPSLNHVDFSLIKKRQIIAINNAYGDRVVIHKDGKESFRYVPRSWVDALWFGDQRWINWHRKWVKNFEGIIAHCCNSCNVDVEGAMKFARGKPMGIDKRYGQIAWNGNSGISGINFAYHLGAKRVVLLGFDMKRVDGQSNYHDDHAPHSDSFPRYLGRLPHVAKDAERLGLEIINCNPDSAIEAWPKMTLEKFLLNEKSSAP